MTNTTNLPYVSNRFGGIADDFFIAILFLKQTDFTNDSLPFLHAHCLELAAKSVVYKYGIDIQTINGHNIIGIYRRIEENYPEFSEFIPTDQHLDDYKKVFIRSNIPNRNAILPNPEELDKLELAFFLDNAKNLKYQFTLDFIQLSIFKISGQSINRSFFNLFNLSRKHYSNVTMDKKLKEKISNAFRDQKDLDKRFFDPLNI